MTDSNPPIDWLPTSKLRWCVHVSPDGIKSEAPHLEQWFTSPDGLEGGFFVIPVEIEVEEI